MNLMKYIMWEYRTFWKMLWGTRSTYGYRNPEILKCYMFLCLYFTRNSFWRHLLPNHLTFFIKKKISLLSTNKMCVQLFAFDQQPHCSQNGLSHIKVLQVSYQFYAFFYSTGKMISWWWASRKLETCREWMTTTHENKG